MQIFTSPINCQFNFTWLSHLNNIPGAWRPRITCTNILCFQSRAQHAEGTCDEEQSSNNCSSNMKLLSTTEPSRGSKFTRSHQHPSPQSGLCGFKKLQILSTAKDSMSCFLFYYVLLVYSPTPISVNALQWSSKVKVKYSLLYPLVCGLLSKSQLRYTSTWLPLYSHLSPWPYEFIFPHHPTLFHYYAFIGIWLYL